MIAMGQSKRMSMLTMDVSVAFMHANLPEGYQQVVRFPKSITDNQGEPIHLNLQKAMNGLRRSPLFWYLELRNALVDQLKFEATAEATIFRRKVGNRLTVVLAYVDDLLIASEDPEECTKVAASLESLYKCKRTGYLERDSVGSLDFLGHQIARTEAGGPLTLGLPASYWDDIETAAELGTLKATDVPPTLKQFQKEEGDPEDEECSPQEQERFRSVLGKLSWFSMTAPTLSFFVSWLSTFQSKPTVRGLKAMGHILKYAKTFRGTVQAFGGENAMEWNGTGPKVVAIIDASWSRKSVAGGIVVWGGSLLKSWSRRIVVPCLSSAEAELFAMVEGLKELQALGILMQTVLEGRGQGQETHSWGMELYSDSEAAVHIGNMHGLLRRVRHLELRVDILQHATQQRGLLLRFVPGSANPADLLTKPSDRSHLQVFMQSFGLQRSGAEEDLQELLSDVVLDLGPLSGHNRRKIAEGLEKGMRKILNCLEEKFEPEAELEEGPAAVEEGVDSTVELESEGELGEEDGEEIPLKVVRFEDDLRQLRSMPRRWHRVIPKQWQVALYWWLAGAGMLVIEVCCEVGSSMSLWCRDKEIPYIGLTVDFRVETVVAALRLILIRKGPVLMWLSTPCTSGSRIRFLNRLSKWPARYQEHLVIWRALFRVFAGFESRPQFLVGREWPQGCDLVYCRAYFRVAKLLGLSEYAIVNRCCLDGCKKTWSIACNDSYFAECLKTGECKCRDIRSLRITERGKYSREVASHVVKAAGKAMTRLQGTERSQS